MHRIIVFILTALLSCACAETNRNDTKTKLYVSILPLKGLVSDIVGHDFEIGVLVPPGTGPETFEPTPRQFAELNRTRMIFQIGWLDFEQSLLGKIEDRGKIVSLNRGIEPLAGSCSHIHNPAEETECTHGHGGHRHHHAHGVDPHLWTSPKELQRMAANAYEAIHAAWPDSVKYTQNYERLREKLEQLDRRTAEKIARSGVRSFIIYHPALTYFARDYALRQVAIESDGKEPSMRRLGEIIRDAQEEGIRKILYQSQYPASVVETLAEDLGGEAVAIDPLREDAIANIDSITDIITSK